MRPSPEFWNQWRHQWLGAQYVLAQWVTGTLAQGRFAQNEAEKTEGSLGDFRR